MEAEIIVPSIMIMALILFFIWYSYKKTEEHTKAYQELQGSYNYLDSRYVSLKKEYDELTSQHNELMNKYHSLKDIHSGEITVDAALLLFELSYYTKEAEILETGTSRYVVTSEFFDEHIEKYNIERRELWKMFHNQLARLGYMKRGGSEDMYEGIHKNWYEITDKARLYFDYNNFRDLKIRKEGLERARMSAEVAFERELAKRNKQRNDDNIVPGSLLICYDLNKVDELPKDIL